MHRPLRVVLALSCLLALLPLAWPQAPAQADEKATTPSGHWVYDVRVVQVQADPIRGLVPAPWEAGDSTVGSTWKEHLAALQARGKIFVMLDQRTSSVRGAKTEVETKTTIPIKRFDNRTMQGETHRFDRIDMGVTVELETEGTLQYRIAVRWLHYPPRDDAVPTATTGWRGSHPRIANGRTLALVNRQHILGPTGEPEVAEHHCFISAHYTGN